MKKSAFCCWMQKEKGRGGGPNSFAFDRCLVAQEFASPRKHAHSKPLPSRPAFVRHARLFSLSSPSPQSPKDLHKTGFFPQRTFLGEQLLISKLSVCLAWKLPTFVHPFNAGRMKHGLPSSSFLL